MHTISTQYAHTQDTEQNTEYNTEQHTENSTQRTEHSTQPQRTEHSTEPQHTPDTDYLHKYNFDIYHEYVAINNSNTIELYTILKD